MLVCQLERGRDGTEGNVQASRAHQRPRRLPPCVRSQAIGFGSRVDYLRRRERSESSPAGNLGVAKESAPGHGANRIKRLIREAFRLGKAELPPGVDLVVLPRGDDLTFAAAQRSLLKLGRDLPRRLKLQHPRSNPQAGAKP